MNAARPIALLALVLAVLLAGYLLLFRGSDGHEYTLVFTNAGQLVKDDDVQVGGRRIGSVRAIKLTDDNQAAVEVEVEEPYAPLREGTKAAVRLTSLSGVANRYVALTLAPDTNPRLDDGATLDAATTTSVVDLDQLFNTIDEKTRGDLQDVVKGFAAQYEGRGEEVGQSAKYFNPLLSTSRELASQLTEDEGALTRFLVNSSQAVTALADRRDDLSGLVTNANQTTGAIAAENVALSEALSLLPTTLRRANTTFVNLRATLDDLDVLVAESKPATKDLAPFLRELRPLVRDARPTIHDLRTLIRRNGADNDLVEATRKMPALQRVASPAFSEGTLALQRTQPVVEFIRPYTPEFVGWLRDFGQSTANYDANGHFARIQPIFNAFTLAENPAGGILTPIPPEQRFDGLESGVIKRCPGAATQRPADGSAPYTDEGNLGPDDCDPSLQLPWPVMRILVPVLLVIVAAVAVVLLTRDDEEPYRVRAIFDNAGFVIPGEDVKVAGVKVGKIVGLDVTDDFKAAVVLRIDDPAYQDFRRDAECQIRPQSLIGERFVECEPTQARQATTEEEPALEKIDDGPGEGQYLLPVENTTKPVDLDLLNNITREPQRARLSIILNELGTGVAGRGGDLDAVIRRANPALKEVDKLLAILASENDTLEQLAVDGDAVLAPLARERRHVSSALANSAEVAEATAERRDELEADIERLPAFLRELKPTMVRLGAFAEEATPVLSDLHAQAPAINRMVTALGPFSEAATPALESLGDASEVGIPAVKAALPITRDLRVFAKNVRPLGATAAKLLGSVQSQRGFERLMDYIFYQVAAVNGFDSFGHYLRAGLIVNQCSTYAATRTPGCSANFPDASATAATAGTDGPSDPILKATADAIARALRGETGGGAERTSAKTTPTPDAVPKLRATPSPSPSPSPAQAAPTPAPTAVPTPVAPAATPTPAPPGSTDEPLLDFLFGKDPG